MVFYNGCSLLILFIYLKWNVKGKKEYEGKEEIYMKWYYIFVVCVVGKKYFYFMGFGKIWESFIVFFNYFLYLDGYGYYL